MAARRQAAKIALIVGGVCLFVVVLVIIINLAAGLAFYSADFGPD